MRCGYRQRWRDPRLVLLSAIFVVVYFSWSEWSTKRRTSCRYQVDPLIFTTRHLLTITNATNSSEEGSVSNVTLNAPQAQFPTDLFTDEQRKKGAVALHVFGLAYMFVALAVVCDEFFVPALDVITEKLDISEDVAGATFMAAGGSAPELFTSVIGVFISYDDVGIGTIVGSAVFNILFVISMCALFSKTVLSLTWWPLFRDVAFYSVSLMVLIACFRDNVIEWFEAASLLACYFAYVAFMKVNEPTERAVRQFLNRSKFTRVGSKDHLVPNMKKRRASTPILHSGSKFRHGLLQLMIHSIDPLHEGKLDEKASQLHAIASLRVLLDAAKANGGYPAGCCPSCTTCPSCAPASTACCPTCQRPLGRTDPPATPTPASLNSYLAAAGDVYPAPLPAIGQLGGAQDLQTATILNTLANGAASELPVDRCEETSFTNKVQAISTITGQDNPAVAILQPGHSASANPVGDAQVSDVVAALQQKAEPEMEVDEPLDLSWPNTTRKRVTYVLMAPIIFPLWLTLPDVRRDEKKKWFFVSFLGSIIWIAIFSYLMVWWATVVGQTIGIPNEVMGLTFLAAGTSIPDLITSVLVARKGFGDMAVSSSIGSNIFDVTVGLPLPWLLSALIFGPVQVSSGGMACSIIILFLMLLFVIVAIACFKWQMNVGLALVMFLLYFVFVAISLLLEYEIINCGAIIGYVAGH